MIAAGMRFSFQRRSSISSVYVVIIDPIRAARCNIYFASQRPIRGPRTDQVPARKRDAARAPSSGLASCGSQSTNGQSINAPRQGKLAEVVALLGRDAGASIEELTFATGWLPHTARAALTDLRKRGCAVPREGKAGGSLPRLCCMDAHA